MSLTKTIYESNRDMLQRFKSEKVRAKYLKREDVLLITIGRPRISYSFTTLNGLLTIHYDPKNNKIYGFTVPYLKEFLLYTDYFKSGRISPTEPINRNRLIEPVANVGMTNLSFA